MPTKKEKSHADTNGYPHTSTVPEPAMSCTTLFIPTERAGEEQQVEQDERDNPQHDTAIDHQPERYHMLSGTGIHEATT